MSTCISRHGEYSDHGPGDWCPRCGAFNEDAIVAERDQLRAAVDRVRAVCAETGPGADWDMANMVLAALDGPEDAT